MEGGKNLPACQLVSLFACQLVSFLACQLIQEKKILNYLRTPPKSKSGTFLSSINAPSNPHDYKLSIGLLIAFVVATWIYWGSRCSGEDLSSAYFACRLMATGNQEVIYSHDPEFFQVLGNPVWQAAVDDVGFREFLHPYVQIPLFAASLKPLCMSMTFNTFNSLFVLLNAISIAGMVWLSTRWLAPSASAPLPILGILIWLWFSHPFQYTMFLTQTHPLILLATLGALIGAERQKEPFSGVLLACAAIIKITPALLLIYWAINGKWKAVAWFLIGVIGLILTSLALAGRDLNFAYFSELKRISDVLLVSWNNESLASLVMGYYFPPEVIGFRILSLPAWLKLTGACFALCMISVAGWLRRLGMEEGAAVSIALVTMTAFAPIAWSHYYIVLLVPIAYLMGRALTIPSIWSIIIVLVLVLMTLYPTGGSFRPFFSAGMIALTSCIAISVIDKRKSNIFNRG